MLKIKEKKSAYIIAIYSALDGDNRIFKILATTPEEAAKKALIEHCPLKYRDKTYINWVNGLGNNLKKISTGAAQSELILTEVLTTN